jgi:hypothetical protein
MAGAVANRMNVGASPRVRTESYADTEDCVDKLALRDSVASGDPADLTFADCMGRSRRRSGVWLSGTRQNPFGVRDLTWHPTDRNPPFPLTSRVCPRHQLPGPRAKVSRRRPPAKSFTR